jgi:hypothetical protein
MFGSVCGFPGVRHICNARHQRQGALQSVQIPAFLSDVAVRRREKACRTTTNSKASSNR